MSITRSQIARQLLAEGGAPRKGFYVGGSPADSQNNPSPSSSFDDGFDSGEEFGRDTYAEQYAAMNVPDAVSTGGGDNEPGFFQKAKDRFKTFETDSRMNRVNRGLLTDLGAIKSFVGLKDIPPELLATLADDYTQGGLFSEGLVGGDISLKNAASTLEGLQGLGVDLTGDIRSQVGDISRSKFAERFGPKTKGGEGGDNETLPLRIKKPITEAAEKEEPKNEFNELLKFYGSRFADGGEVRQGYGLGSIVKKAKSAVGKVFKSPLGKAAILAFGAKFAKPDIFANAFAKDSFIMKNKALSGILAASLASGALAKQDEDDDEKLPTVAQSDPEFQNLLAYYGGPTRFAAEGGDIEDAPKEKPSGIMMASNIENDEILENLFEKYLDMGLSPKDAADKAREEFEKMSKAKEPDRMMANEGGLMNLGGNEMDLRGGGFVPLGAKEKADDVPARLSKNEFVFTADAVRAAGGGSVDRGADIMYKTMKNLENKVA
jgi:hypothetical protein